MIILPKIDNIKQIETKNLDPDTVKMLIDAWDRSETAKDIKTGNEYLLNKKDIRDKQRIHHSEAGPTILKALSNIRLPIATFRNIVSQKAAFLLARKFLVKSDNIYFEEAVNKWLDSSMRRKILGIAQRSIASGICWSIQYYNQGVLSTRVVPGTDIIPIWDDQEHERLVGAIHRYTITEADSIDGDKNVDVHYIDLYSSKSLHRYKTTDNNIEHDGSEYLYMVDEIPFDFGRVPVIPWKCNNDEVPLINLTKDIIDAGDHLMSMAVDTLLDNRQSTKVIKGYAHLTDNRLAEFIKNLTELGAIFVDKDGGSVETLDTKLDVTALKEVIELLTKDLYTTSSCVNASDDNLGNASGVTIKFRYQPMIISGMEMALCFEQSLRILFDFFIKDYNLKNTVQIPEDVEYDIIFDMDLPLDEGEIIDYLLKTRNLVSDETILDNIPFITDPQRELDRVNGVTRSQQSISIPNSDIIPDQQGGITSIERGSPLNVPTPIIRKSYNIDTMRPFNA